MEIRRDQGRERGSEGSEGQSKSENNAGSRCRNLKSSRSRGQAEPQPQSSRSRSRVAVAARSSRTIVDPSQWMPNQRSRQGALTSGGQRSQLPPQSTFSSSPLRVPSSQPHGRPIIARPQHGVDMSLWAVGAANTARRRGADGEPEAEHVRERQLERLQRRVRLACSLSLWRQDE